MSVNYLIKGRTLQPEGRSRPYFRQAAFSVAVVAIVEGVLHLAWGDVYQFIGYSSILLGSCAYLMIGRFSNTIKLQAFAIPGMLFCTSVLSVIIPPGIVLFSYFTFIGLLFFSLTKTSLFNTAALFGVFSVPFIWQLVGLPTFHEAQLPTRFAYLASVLATTPLIWNSVNGTRRKLDSTLLKIRDSEKAIRKEEKKCEEQRLSILKTNSDLSRMAKGLAIHAQKEKELMSQLVHKTDDQQGLVHAIHHDLREPLRSIVSFTQLIDKRLAGHQEAQSAREYIAYAIDGGKRMTSMLEDLLRYTKHEDEESTEVDLEKLVQDLIVDLSDTLTRHNGRVVLDKLPVVHGLPTQLRQLFQNLIANALKFSREEVPPVVTISCKKIENGRVSISVADNGIGIPSNQIESVFGLFNRAHQGDGYEGSGVGLALCRRIALVHDAELSVESEENVGTTFWIDGLGLTTQEDSDTACTVVSAATTLPSQSLLKI